MIDIVLDTNVFISGIFWSGPPCQILAAWRDRKVKLITSPDIIDEYSKVSELLSKKYKKVDASPIIELVTLHSEIHEPVQLPAPISRDPDDDKFIACALSAQCKTIVSGDKDLLDIQQYGNIEFVKAANFVKKHLT